MEYVMKSVVALWLDQAYWDNYNVYDVLGVVRVEHVCVYNHMCKFVSWQWGGLQEGYKGIGQLGIFMVEWGGVIQQILVVSIVWRL